MRRVARKCVQLTPRVRIEIILVPRANTQKRLAQLTKRNNDRAGVLSTSITDTAVSRENRSSRFSLSGGKSVRATTTKESGELEEFLCYAKCILTETREPLDRRAWTTLVLYIISLCALCTAGSFDKELARDYCSSGKFRIRGRPSAGFCATNVNFAFLPFASRRDRVSLATLVTYRVT